MQFGEVQIPPALLDAQEEGTLVVFAGAGVSMPPPSSLPDFNSLVVQVGEGASPRVGNETPDQYLGRLEQEGVQVRERVAAILGGQESRPSALHEVVLKLFRERAQVRLVTTNFDLHFSRVLQEVSWNDAPVHVGPALPLGDCFDGLVYLHGNVLQPEELVLTDRDFGAAYLTRGWATRFLLDLFSSDKVVLFVGYSHSDPVLMYLARGLPPAEKPNRFALAVANSTDLDRWKPLGVEPIAYPNEDGGHESLREAFEKWVAFSGEDLLGRKQRMERLFSIGPDSLSPEDRDYLKHGLGKPQTAQFARGKAVTRDWAVWAIEVGILDPVFGTHPEGSRHRHSLAHWIIDDLLCVACNELLGFLREGGRAICPELAQLLVYALFHSQRDLPALGRLWLPFLLERSQIANCGQWIATELAAFTRPEESSVALLCLDRLFQPVQHLGSSLRIVSEEPLEMEREPRWESEMEIEPYYIEQFWGRAGSALLQSSAAQVLALAGHHLRMAHVLEETDGPGDTDWDRVSMARRCIEEDAQNVRSADSLGPWIGIARDALEWCLEHEPILAQATIGEWWHSRCPILRRLAIHGVDLDPARAPEDRMRWLLENEALRILWFRHEVFMLLKHAYPGAGTETRESLLQVLAELVAGEGDAVKADRQLYDLLEWLQRADPTCELVGRRLQAVLTRNPNFKPGKHPDLLTWTESGSGTGGLAMPVEDLSADDPAELATRIADAIISDGYPSATTLFDNLSEAFVRDRALFRRLAPLTAGGSLARRLVVENAASVWIKPEDAKSVVAWLDEIEAIGDLTGVERSVLGVLTVWVDKHGSDLDDASLERCEALALKLAVSADGGDLEPGEDWLLYALNHPGGEAARIMLRSVEWRRQRLEEWTGIPPHTRDRLEKLLGLMNSASGAAETMVAGRLHYLLILDPEWTRTHVLPLFEWEEGGRAVRAWHGFLGWGQPNGLPVALAHDLYSAAFRHCGSELVGQAERMAEHVVWLAFGRVRDPLQDGWLAGFFRHAPPNARASWFEAAAHVLRDIREPLRLRAWSDWLRRMLEERIQGIPVPLSPEEVSGLLLWTPEMAEVFPELCQLLVQMPQPDSAHSLAPFRLAERDDIIKAHPQAVVNLLLHLRTWLGTGWYCNELARIGNHLLATDAGQNDLRRYCELLLNLNCPQANDFCARVGANGLG